MILLHAEMHALQYTVTVKLRMPESLREIYSALLAGKKWTNMTI